MKADLHSWELLGIPRNSQKAGNSFRKGISREAGAPNHGYLLNALKTLSAYPEYF